MIAVSPVNSEPNAVIETGAEEMRRINAENWWNSQFVMLLAGIAVFVFYVLLKPPLFLRSKDQILKDTSSQKHAAGKPSGSDDFQDPVGISAISKTKPVTREEIEEEFAKVSEANYRPDEDQDDETDKSFKVVFKGAKWGFVVGSVIAMVYIQMHTVPSLGFYPGDAGLVFFACIGPATAAGALFAWLSTLFPSGE